MKLESLQPLNWMEVMEVDVPEIDADHRSLLRECNALMTMVQTDADWSATAAASRQMIAHFADHFRLEEAVLAQSKFPRLQDHVRDHGRIAANLERLVGEIERAEGSRDAMIAKVAALRAALVDIFLKHDLDYKSHLLVAQGR